MKKIIISIAIFAIPLATFGAVQAVKEIKSYDFVAQVQTMDSKSVQVYKFDDSGNTCYVAYTAGFTNGNNTNISCVNTPVVPVVKK